MTQRDIGISGSVTKSKCMSNRHEHEVKPSTGMSLYLENNVKQCIYLLNSKATEVSGENVFSSLSRKQRN